MINDIISCDGSLVISNMGSSGPYVAVQVHDPRAVAGDVRYNNNNFEVHDGMNWLQMNRNSVDVQLLSMDREAINWAKNKMLKEADEEELLKKHPTLKKAKEQYETIKALVEHDK